MINLNELTETTVVDGSKYNFCFFKGELLPIGHTKYKELRELWGLRLDECLCDSPFRGMLTVWV